MLYNVERPEIFENVLGQDSIVKVLSEQAKRREFAHSYLFEGNHGSGKTTVARMLGKSANCLHPKEDGSPCGECENCRAIQGGCLDFVELDAASNNGVDDIREIIGSSQYQPAILKYKIYIIDEVHMLSNGAFNALLKTLEEPPSYCIFFLCTTEKHKVPATILSRSMIFTFTAIDEVTIASHLDSLCKKYNCKADLDALYIIARAANGAMRDALSLLDQCMSLKQDLTENVVREVLGYAKDELVFDLLNSMIMHNTNEAVKALNDLLDTGVTVNYLIAKMIEIVSDAVLFKQAGIDIVINTSVYKKYLCENFSDVSIDKLIAIIDTFSNAKFDLAKDSTPRIAMQMLIIKECIFYEKEDRISELEKRIIALEKCISNNTNPFRESVASITNNEETANSEPYNTEIDEAENDDIGNSIENEVSADNSKETEPDNNDIPEDVTDEYIKSLGFDVGESVDLNEDIHDSYNEEYKDLDEDADFEEFESNIPSGWW